MAGRFRRGGRSAAADADPCVSAAGRDGLLCPSAQPEMPGTQVFGLVDHAVEPPSVAYLQHAEPVTEDLLAIAAPVRPTEMFRFAAPCAQHQCSHWDGAAGGLVQRIVQRIPVATFALPPCAVRTECRWFAQEGRAACRRCPRVVTQDESPSEEMRDSS